MSASSAAAGRESGRALSGLLHGLPWLLVLVLTALNVLHAVRIGPNDDAFITYRVARNLANGLGPVFNPGERVLSITTPGYMLLLAASSVLNQDFVALGLLWSGLGLLATGALLIDASRLEPERHPLLASLAAAVAVALTLSNPLLSAALGMETPLYLAALLAVFAAYRRALQQPAASQGWLLATAAAAAAAFLIRPDGLLAGLVVGVHWLATQHRGAQRWGPVPWRALALGLALVLPWLLFAWSYYGSPVPNTLAAKITQGLPDREGQWGRQLLEVGRQWIGANPLAAALALVGLAMAVRPTASGLRYTPAQPAGLRLRRLMLVWAVCYVGIHVALRARGYFWYYVPLAPLVALLAGDGAAGVVRWLDRWRAGPLHSRLWGVARPLLVASLLIVLFYPVLAPARALASVPPPGQRDTVYRQTGLLLRELCSQPGHEPVGMAEIGILGYVSDCQVLDFSGLLQPKLAHLRLPAAEKISWALKSYAPPLAVLSGSSGYPGMVADQPWFRQRYEPYDIQDDRGFLSVIYRRAMGPATQRDLGAVGWWRQDAPASRPVTATLVFPLDVTPAITLHAYLPPDSGLAVTARGQPVLTLAGAEPAWRDVRLPDVEAVDRVVTLALTGHAAGQPAAVAWVESNAVPSVHYFAPFVEAAAQPRPSLRLELGESAQAMLAPAAPGSAVLDVAYRDRPGVRLAVLLDGQELGVVGGAADAWQVARLLLPAGALATRPAAAVELRNQAQQFVRIYYAALVDPARPPYRP